MHNTMPQDVRLEQNLLFVSSVPPSHWKDLILEEN